MAFGLTIYHLGVMFVLPSLLLISLYVTVIRKLKASTRDLEGMTHTRANRKRNKTVHRVSNTQTLLSKNGQTQTSLDVNGNNEDEGKRSTGSNSNRNKRNKKSKFRSCFGGGSSRRSSGEQADRSNYGNDEIGRQAEGFDEEVRMSLSSLDSSFQQPASNSSEDKTTWQRLTACCHKNNEDDTNNTSHNNSQEPNGIRHDDISLCTMSTSYPVMTVDGNSGARFIRRDSELTVQGDINNTTNTSNDTASPTELNDDEIRVTANAPVSPKASFRVRSKSSSSSSSVVIAGSNQPQTSRSIQQQQLRKHRASECSTSKSTMVTSHKSFVRVQEDYSATVNKGAIEVIRSRTHVSYIKVSTKKMSLRIEL